MKSTISQIYNGKMIDVFACKHFNSIDNDYAETMKTSTNV